MIRYRAGHTGKIFLIVAIDTQDEVWARKAMDNLDQSKVRRVRLENIINGSETI